MDRPDIRLDVLIKKEEDYYTAHCLQFDIVATDDTRDGIKKAILDLCVSHIQFSYENNNMEYLFPPAPKEVWAEYFTLVNNKDCSMDFKELPVKLSSKDAASVLPPFMIQEIMCNEQAPVYA